MSSWVHRLINQKFQFDFLNLMEQIHFYKLDCHHTTLRNTPQMFYFEYFSFITCHVWKIFFILNKCLLNVWIKLDWESIGSIEPWSSVKIVRGQELICVCTMSILAKCIGTFLLLVNLLVALSETLWPSPWQWIWESTTVEY